MKKHLSMMLLAASAMTLTACSNNEGPDGPDPEVPTTAEGAYILNQGNYGKQIEGSLTFLDYNSSTASQELFQRANGRSLGATPQGAVVYGSKIYVGVYESNVIEIMDRNTYKSIKQISLSDAEGQSPRSLVAKDGKVYISMFNGYVSRLDTLSLTIDKTVKVGPNPDIIAIRGKYLYVPNSDGMNWQNGYGTTASKINLDSFSVEKTFTVGLNPTEFVSNGSDLFLLCRGNYADVTSKVYRLDNSDNSTEVDDATLIAIKGGKLYYINAPWGATEIPYTVLDVATGEKRNMLEDSGVDNPAGFGVDPTTGYIVITSYSMENGQTSFTANGYAKVYDENGKFLKRYDTGLEPRAVFFK